jgi:fatty-acyl-CoA synthase
MAGTTCPPDLMEKVIQHLGLTELGIAYGMTETSPVSFFTPIDSSFDKRTTTVGRIMPHTECKIVETKFNEEEGALYVEDDPQVVDLGQQGELWTRGYCVMLKYWNDPKKTKSVITDDGWLRTGDLAVFDNEGFCKIVGRLKDVIIRGGENIYPSEIEEILRRHPDVHDA